MVNRNNEIQIQRNGRPSKAPMAPNIYLFMFDFILRGESAADYKVHIDSCFFIG